MVNLIVHLLRSTRYAKHFPQSVFWVRNRVVVLVLQSILFIRGVVLLVEGGGEAHREHTGTGSPAAGAQSA